MKGVWAPAPWWEVQHKATVVPARDCLKLTGYGAIGSQSKCTLHALNQFSQMQFACYWEVKLHTGAPG